MTQHSSPMTEQLFQSCLSELTEGHLALDRLEAPREVQEGEVIRECLIAERISSVAQTPSSSVQHGADYLFDELDKLGAHVTYTACKGLVTKLYALGIPAQTQPDTNPCAAILDHKWLDPNCVENGCQSLVLAADIKRYSDLAGDFGAELMRAKAPAQCARDAGLEEAAKYHDRNAADCRAIASVNMDNDLGADSQTHAIDHEIAADDIRAMKGSTVTSTDSDGQPNVALEGLKAAIRAAELALFVIRKQGVMPNSSWEGGFERDMQTARDARNAIDPSLTRPDGGPTSQKGTP